MDRRAWLSLWTLGAIWGASYLFIKIGVRDLSPSMVAFVRVGLAALVLVPFAAAQGALDGFGARWRAVAVVAAVQVAIPFVLIPAGEEEIPSALAGILVASTPLFTAILAIRVDHEERSEGLRLLGVFAGFAGVALLLGVDLGGSGAEIAGGAMIVLASLGYSIGGFVVKHRLSELQPIGVSAVVMVASTAMLIAPAAATAPSKAPGIGPIAAVVALGIVGTGIAFALFYTLIARIGPARAFIVTYLAPLFAVAYGATLLEESIGVATIGGMALILAGSWLAAEGRLPGSAGAPPKPAPERATAGASVNPSPAAASRAWLPAEAAAPPGRPRR